MQPSGEVGRFEVADQPSPSADRNRYAIISPAASFLHTSFFGLGFVMKPITLQMLLSLVLVSTLVFSSTASAQDSDARNVQLLQKEIELLKKEVELLRSENEQLKKQIASMNEGTPTEVQDKPDAVLNGVEYKFVSIKTEGNDSTLKISITSRDRDQRIPELVAVTLITADGRSITGPTPSLERSTRVRKGVTQVVSYPLGTIPEDIKSFETIILPAGDNPNAARNNPARLRGSFKVE
jgi:hypothetical protein